MLVFGRRLLDLILWEYACHNERRPYRGLDLDEPLPGNRTSATPRPLRVRRHEVFGGLTHEYTPAAA
jgi:hypothetical protein